MGLRSVFGFGLAAAALCWVAGAEAVTKAKPPQQIAWLQEKNIGRNGLRGTHTVALTFDDGPNDSTRGVLEALNRYDVKATFFIVGKMAKRHPDVLKEIADAGHLLGNHSATHVRLGEQYAKKPRLLIDQLRVVDTSIRPLMKDNETLFFRAPYGYWKPRHATVLNKDSRLKYYIGPIYWDIGGETRLDSEGYIRTSSDWDCWERGWTPTTCAKGYLRDIHAKDGGVVLMHAIHPKARALINAVVPTLQREGYKFVRLDALKEYDQYKTPRFTSPFIASAERAIPELRRSN